jgi:hypothetical protein
MPGLAVTQQSSAAYAEMGAQAERALNTGWILDQRPDGAGGFITNASPTSSGLTFVSTGDGTPIYIIGRVIRVIQAAQTAVCTVGQSSFSGGITNVFLNQFSTAAGLSTTLSTGAITSAAVGEFFPQSTANNTFGGATILVSTGGNPSLALGFAAASAGSLRIPNNASGLRARNAANTADVPLIDVNGADQIQIAAFGQVSQFGGTIRIPNSPQAINGKTSTGGDDIIWPAQFSSTTLATDVVTSGVNFTNVFSKTLPVGTWWINAGTVITTNTINAWAGVRIDDGTNTFGSAFGSSNQLQAGTTNSGTSLVCGAIVSHTTALAYNFALASNSTTTTAKAIAPNGASTGATWWTALKIG